MANRHVQPRPGIALSVDRSHNCDHRVSSFWYRVFTINDTSRVNELKTRFVIGRIFFVAARARVPDLKHATSVSLWEAERRRGQIAVAAAPASLFFFLPSVQRPTCSGGVRTLYPTPPYILTKLIHFRSVCHVHGRPPILCNMEADKHSGQLANVDEP